MTTATTKRQQSGDPLISVDDVTFGYGEVPVLESVSIDVDPGSFLGLVGPNGSGKSTLLDLMLGLRRPDEGTVSLFGEPAHKFDAGERIGYVAQDATKAARDMPITVREVVEMGRYPRRLFGRFSAADRQAIEDALEQVGITDLASRRVGRLSGGQRQRVFIARALASEADLLALDEPTVGVDAESREEFYGLIHDLNATGLTVILIEHDIGVVTTHATDVACLNRQLFFDGDPEEFVETDALSQAYGKDQHILQHDHE
ncbi:metal ABC transporter ATP-binding protein [Halorubrum ezzemoulense]|jgi:zinc transport system ATP-binding protein|uniref:metal ABC transporter ATP-binding protein n=1 Tax=Halorubrum ezzemoulense TaxID=337243 RepID=UPI00232EAEDA|nr:metal ABC transporter ATP-binding protein [Halorubrum ezzemoulense]MDB9250563.1 metal ABC transporter ATP-binding protein [Halorubrum ezzemoulense]MDB9260678.1 metal ABC transporter ATP-binding protein [Halorubrum ezzemoulense]MDB9264067.1 metal ABC transporter ATP-binding protein [Halorubrum ezzemoulense]MDB9267577.1 metal ABC transporter ATP-binding protein [Halorubrum ezzemoulense]MDB9271039.1 metal ABC transporter ATP-binding protein [Halorubrum ezzemoulense]